ncbi:MAG: hypothetical protein QM785_14440 [Pyrinomonadaceae bacterium]
MSDVFSVRFEKEAVEGIVAKGVSLAGAGKSFGVRSGLCGNGEKEHVCTVIVTSGIDLLNELTATETEHFDRNGRRSNERLACEARIIKPGEIVVMTKENTQETKKEAAKDPSDIHAEFNLLPLDKKFASLLQMEATTINEAVKYVADSSMKALEKLGEAISDIGAKVGDEAKKATETTAAAEESSTENGRSKAGSKRKPAAEKE